MILTRCPSCKTTKKEFFTEVQIQKPKGAKEFWIKCQRCGFSFRKR